MRTISINPMMIAASIAFAAQSTHTAEMAHESRVEKQPRKDWWEKTMNSDSATMVEGNFFKE
jgi:hypothetical protein